MVGLKMFERPNNPYGWSTSRTSNELSMENPLGVFVCREIQTDVHI